MCEHDPDLVRWGLHLLQDALTDHPTTPDSNSDPNYSSNTDCYSNRMIKEDITRSENGHVKNQNMVENDEAIAYTLQQELAQLAKEEASGMSCENYEPVLNQVWLNDSTGSKLHCKNQYRNLYVEDLQSCTFMCLPVLRVLLAFGNW